MSRARPRRGRRPCLSGRVDGLAQCASEGGASPELPRDSRTARGKRAPPLLQWRVMKAATMKRVGIPTWQLLSLAGNARLDPRTVAAVLAGRGGANSHQQVIDAAARL